MTDRVENLSIVQRELVARLEFPSTINENVKVGAVASHSYDSRAKEVDFHVI